MGPRAGPTHPTPATVCLPAVYPRASVHQDEPGHSHNHKRDTQHKMSTERTRHLRGPSSQCKMRRRDIPSGPRTAAARRADGGRGRTVRRVQPGARGQPPPSGGSCAVTLTFACGSLETWLSYARQSPALTLAAHSGVSASQLPRARPPLCPTPWGLGPGSGWVAPSSFSTAVGFPLFPYDPAPLTLLTMAAHVQVAEVSLELRSHHDLLQRQSPRGRGRQEAGRGADEGPAAARSPGLG